MAASDYLRRETLTVEEAARLLGIGRTAGYRAANSGALPVLRLGGRLLVLRRPLEEMLGIEEVKDRKRAERGQT